MTQVYFHCSNPQRAFCSIDTAPLSAISRKRRSWILHVSDNLGDELFVVPFAFVLGKPH
jgi:hypothetical protein